MSTQGTKLKGGREEGRKKVREGGRRREKEEGQSFLLLLWQSAHQIVAAS